jgi:hypothetical protein
MVPNSDPRHRRVHLTTMGAHPSGHGNFFTYGYVTFSQAN